MPKDAQKFHMNACYPLKNKYRYQKIKRSYVSKTVQKICVLSLNPIISNWENYANRNSAFGTTLLANCPHAASISLPLLRRSLAFMRAFDK